MMKITATNALATRCFPNCKWYIVMVVSLIFLLGTSFCYRGSSGNTVHGTFVVISPSPWSNIMTITCVVLWLVRILHLPGESVKKKNGGYVFVHGSYLIGFFYRGASPSMVLFSYCCA